MQKSPLDLCEVRDCLRKRPCGFTLVELVFVLVLVAIMAAVVIPRFAQRSGFDALGFAEQTRAALRYAQKAAIAKRRQVCVRVAANIVTLTVATTFGGACKVSLLNPADGKPYVVPQNTLTGIAIASASFSFDALGRPSAAQSLAVTGGDIAPTVTVEAETGLVH